MLQNKLKVLSLNLMWEAEEDWASPTSSQIDSSEKFKFTKFNFQRFLFRILKRNIEEWETSLSLQVARQLHTHKDPSCKKADDDEDEAERSQQKFV